MKSLYVAPEAELLEIKLATDICGPSQAEIVDPGVGDKDGDEI